MAAIGAEAQVPGTHRDREAGRDRLLAEREVARALDQVLQEQVERALLAFADLDLNPIQAQARFLADIVVQAGPAAAGARSSILAINTLRQ